MRTGAPLQALGTGIRSALLHVETDEKGGEVIRRGESEGVSQEAVRCQGRADGNDVADSQQRSFLLQLWKSNGRKEEEAGHVGSAPTLRKYDERLFKRDG